MIFSPIMARRHSGRTPSVKRSAPVNRFQSFGSLRKKSASIFSSVKERIKPGYKKTVVFTRRRPFLSFFLALGILFLLIVGGNIISGLQKKPETRKEIVKEVKAYTVGESPKVALQAEVNQEGTIQIVAQTPGIVQEIYVAEGDHVNRAQAIVSLSSNYQGGNAPGLQAQLAGAQYKNVKETYDTQKEIIAKQREVTEKTSNNTEELRKISENSREETSNLLNLNETILNTLSDNVTELQQNGATEAQILAAQSQQAQAQAGVNQLRSALRGLEYQVNTDNPPTQLANLQKDISLKQLDIQEKALALSRESSKIQYNLALVQAAMMRPSSPFSGTVERILVTPGQAVNPGTPIAIISSDNPKATLAMLVPFEIATNISRAEPSTLTIGRTTLKLTPSYVSTVATNELLYTVLYTLPEEYINKVSDNSFIAVEAPLANATRSGVHPFIPIDSVFQSQNASYVFIAKNSRVESRKVELGNVYGSFVEVLNGISDGDQIIESRNIVTGEKVKVTK